MWWFVTAAPGNQYRAFPVALVVKNPPANAGDMRRKFDPWVRKIPWRRARQPTQDSCLENPMDRRAWLAAVHGATKELDTTYD